jgi:hypothetical protein
MTIVRLDDNEVHIPYDREVRIEVAVEWVSRLEHMSPHPDPTSRLRPFTSNLPLISYMDGRIESIRRMFVHRKDFDVLIPYEKGVRVEVPVQGVPLPKPIQRTIIRGTSPSLPRPQTQNLEGCGRSY